MVPVCLPEWRRSGKVNEATALAVHDAAAFDPDEPWDDGLAGTGDEPCEVAALLVDELLVAVLTGLQQRSTTVQAMLLNGVVQAAFQSLHDYLLDRSNGVCFSRAGAVSMRRDLTFVRRRVAAAAVENLVRLRGSDVSVWEQVATCGGDLGWWGKLDTALRLLSVPGAVAHRDRAFSSVDPRWWQLRKKRLAKVLGCLRCCF